MRGRFEVGLYLCDRVNDFCWYEEKSIQKNNHEAGSKIVDGLDFCMIGSRGFVLCGDPKHTLRSRGSYVDVF